jgi:hypothetical protein
VAPPASRPTSPPSRRGCRSLPARQYYLTIAEHLDEHWSSWFDGLTITHHSDGTSTLAGPVRDQSALYGLIDKARDLGLTLVAVGRAAPPGLTDKPTV